MFPNSNQSRKTITVFLVPFYDGEKTIRETLKNLHTLLHPFRTNGITVMDSYILFLSDENDDYTFTILSEYAVNNNSSTFELSCNLKKQNNYLAGLHCPSSQSQFTFLQDSDIQDDINIVADLVRLYPVGICVLQGIRKIRASGLFETFEARLVYVGS